jgi:putative FmdB family regulatory protein
MPIYEYRCGHGHTFEVMQRMSDDPVTTCETCEAPVARVFHPVAIHFKGKGFYNTDYGTRNRSRELKDAADGSGKHAKDEGGSKSDKGDGGSTSSDAPKSSSAETKPKSSDSGTAAAA